MELNQARIEDAVIQEVADRLISNDDLYAHAKRLIENKVNKLWSSQVELKLTLHIDSMITNGFDHEYTRVNTFGQAEGEKTSIRKELEKQISGYWNQKVDQSGKPVENYYAKLTRAEWVMAKMCADDFSGEMQKHIVNVTSSLKEEFRKQLHDTVNQLLSNVFKVKDLPQGPVASPTGLPVSPPWSGG